MAGGTIEISCRATPPNKFENRERDYERTERTTRKLCLRSNTRARPASWPQPKQQTGASPAKHGHMVGHMAIGIGSGRATARCGGADITHTRIHLNGGYWHAGVGNCSGK